MSAVATQQQTQIPTTTEIPANAIGLSTANATRLPGSLYCNDCNAELRKNYSHPGTPLCAMCRYKREFQGFRLWRGNEKPFTQAELAGSYLLADWCRRQAWKKVDIPGELPSERLSPTPKWVVSAGNLPLVDEATAWGLMHKRNGAWCAPRMGVPWSPKERKQRELDARLEEKRQKIVKQQAAEQQARERQAELARHDDVLAARLPDARQREAYIRVSILLEPPAEAARNMNTSRQAFARLLKRAERALAHGPRHAGRPKKTAP